MVIRPHRLLAAAGATAVISAAAIALAGGPASAATSAVSTGSVSGNWAGYVAQGNNFSSVRGSWVQPSATCSSPGTYSAFWVGLGGASGQSNGLEQIGTQADCTSSGSTSYYSWYELVPAAPVRLDLAVKPGDHMTGAVTVKGTTVVVSLANTTTGQSVTKTLQTSNIDTSSAEWIAEAPSECDNDGSCQPLSLANFGSTTFTNATATAAGHTGPINDSAWQAQSVTLDGSNDQGFGPRGVSYDGGAGSGSAAGAQASGLSSSGSSFTVTYEANGASPSSGQSGQGTGGGSGYGYGSDPGAGGYGGGYGYGDGSGGYGGGSYSYGGGYGYGYGGGTYGYDPGYGDGGAGSVYGIY